MIILKFKNRHKCSDIFNDFNGKRDIILEKATKVKLLLSDKTKCSDQDMFDQFFEDEWQHWTSDLKLPEHEIPCINFMLLLKKEMDTLTSDLQIENEEIDKIKSFYERYEKKYYLLDVFVIGDNHYQMFAQDHKESSHIPHKYFCWLDYALSIKEKVSDTDFQENIPLKKVIDVKVTISEACENYIKKIINQEFSCQYFSNIIKIILNSVQEFNNKEKIDKTIEIRVRIENVFIYELALFLCAKLILRFKNKNKHKPNQMDTLKTQIRSQFKHFYNNKDEENYSSSMACANGLANVLLEKMNLHVAEEIQFLIIDEFSNFSKFSVSSKFQLQTNVLTDLANESSFDKYWKYIHEPNQAMKDWIIEKFQEFCKQDSTISRINAWYKESICKHVSTYSEALHQLLKPIEEKLTSSGQEYTLKDKGTENSNISSDWKAQLHKKLEGEHTRQFKLSDLDVLLIEPHELNNPSEFVSFFIDSLQKLSVGFDQLISWIKTYLMAEILTNFSETFFQNLFYCDEHCPLCNEPCLSNINSSEHKHYCGSFHRPLGLNGWFKIESKEFIGYDCTNLKHKDEINYYKHGNSIFDICKQRSRSWDNSSKHYMIGSVYWEWVMCNFKDELADHYQYKINDKAIKAWSNLTKSQVLNELQLQMNDFQNPSYMWRMKK